MIMNITTKKAQWENMPNLIDDYFSELGYQNDGFHSDTMFEGNPYFIKQNDAVIGFFSLGDSWDGGKMFRAFYLLPDKRSHSRAVFEQLTDEFAVEAVLVASNDAHLVGLAFEKMHALGTHFDMQAFNFIYGKPAREAEFGIECLCRVTDFVKMNKLTEGQWDGMFDNERNQFYELKLNGELLGYGGISAMKYTKNADIGNYVLPEHRRKGVGRSLLIHLGMIAIEQGLTPVAGCWYGNSKSVATLTSAGFIPKNRVFYVRFR